MTRTDESHSTGERIRHALLAEARRYTPHHVHAVPQPSSHQRSRRTHAVPALVSCAGLLLAVAAGAWLLQMQSSDSANQRGATPRGAVPRAGDVQGVVAELEIPANTSVKAGDSLQGTVVVTNHTGRPQDFTGCGELFQVVLHNESAAQQRGGFACALSFSIPDGSSSYPVTISTRYSACVPGGSTTAPDCLASGTAPPLPAGEYQADLVVPGGITVGGPSTQSVTVQ